MQRLLIAVLVSLAVIATTYAETTCESHRRNSQTSGHTLKWNIKCDKDGYYEPLQCTDAEREDKKWCACYNKEEAITSPSMKRRHCECALAKDQATNSNADECDILECNTTDGKYKAKQCCATTRKCYCVNTNTGAKISEPTSDTNLSCTTH